MKHLIDPTDLSKQELEEIIDLALDIIDNREKYIQNAARVKNSQRSSTSRQPAHA